MPPDDRRPTNQTERDSPTRRSAEMVNPMVTEASASVIPDPATISGQPIVSSPIDEDGPVNSHLDPIEESRVFAPSAGQRSHPGRERGHSIHSAAIDEGGMTGNPSHRVRERFASTSTNASFTSSTYHEGVEGRSRANTAQSSRQSSGRANSGRETSSALPADDGQGDLRRKIVEIRDMDLPNAHKAQLMHHLMTEQYLSSHHTANLPHLAPPHSPSSFQNSDAVASPKSSGRRPSPSSASSSSSSSIKESTNIYNLSADDFKPTYVPRTETAQSGGSGPPTGPVELDNAPETDLPSLGCAHYKRNVKLQCSACHKWYTCRFCHDEVEDHSLNRRETKNMLCMLCGCAQPAGENCMDCEERTAWYYCDICKLWDDDSEKSIYHCNDCGICRIGRGLGKDFYHCMKCCVCMSISIAQSHKCIERSTDCDCPICGEYMFSSPLTVVFMPCGHSIHHKCYYDHMKSSYRCPICSRSIVNMETQFRNLDRAIDDQPMPAQFQDTRALVYCNDCCAKSSVKYHWLGLKCSVCDSYNTAQLHILSGTHPDPAVDPAVAAMQGIDPSTVDLARLPNEGAVPLPPYVVPAHQANTTGSSTVGPPPVVHGPSGAVDLAQVNASDGTAAVDEGEEASSDVEDEEMDFWGGEVLGLTSQADLDLASTLPSASVPRPEKTAADDDDDTPLTTHSDEESEESEDETAELSVEVEDDDDDDEVDKMEIFGHR
ncbi:MAG: hypothetical protein M1825_005031 [Sarcosagium campestre]|nr:MAG: hypothetical protein M1825_005031 [Sarcosagium campestre]